MSDPELELPRIGLGPGLFFAQGVLSLDPDYLHETFEYAYRKFLKEYMHQICLEQHLLGIVRLELRTTFGSTVKQVTDELLAEIRTRDQQSRDRLEISLTAELDHVKLTLKQYIREELLRALLKLTDPHADTAPTA